MKYGTLYRVPGARPPVDRDFLLWTAGFMDGDGCFLWRSGCVIVQVTNCHLPSLVALCEAYGGSIRPVSPRHGNYRAAFQWSLVGSRARALVRALQPHLREKRAQVDLILTEPLTPPGGRLTDEDRARRVALRQRLSALKRVGFAASWLRARPTSPQP